MKYFMQFWLTYKGAGLRLSKNETQGRKDSTEHGG